MSNRTSWFDSGLYIIVGVAFWFYPGEPSPTHFIHIWSQNLRRWFTIAIIEVPSLKLSDFMTLYTPCYHPFLSMHWTDITRIIVVTHHPYTCIISLWHLLSSTQCALRNHMHHGFGRVPPYRFKECKLARWWLLNNPVHPFALSPWLDIITIPFRNIRKNWKSDMNWTYQSAPSQVA